MIDNPYLFLLLPSVPTMSTVSTVAAVPTLATVPSMSTTLVLMPRFQHSLEGLGVHVGFHVLLLYNILHVLFHEVQEVILALVHIVLGSDDGHVVGIVLPTWELDLHLGVGRGNL